MKNPGKDAVEISKYISSFLKDYAPEHLAGSEHTVRSYEAALTLYIGFLEEEGITSDKLNIQCFDQETIEKWLSWLSNTRGCSPSTCNSRLSSLRAFLKYLASRNAKYVSVSNEAARVKLRKTPGRVVSGMSRDAVKALMEEPDPKDKVGLRDLAFMVTLYATAVRLDELLSLKLRDVHLNADKPYITVLGKRNKLRTLYLLPRAVDHLRQYISVFHDSSSDDEAYLFYSRTKGRHTKMTQAGISKMLRKYAKSAHEKCPDVPLGLHAHQFRHAKASHWLEDGMNIVQISFLLGHANLETTMIYLDISLEQKAEAMATLESESQKGTSAKWKGHEDSLASLCGLRVLKK